MEWLSLKRMTDENSNCDSPFERRWSCILQTPTSAVPGYIEINPTSNKIRVRSSTNQENSILCLEDDIFFASKER